MDKGDLSANRCLNLQKILQVTAAIASRAY